MILDAAEIRRILSQPHRYYDKDQVNCRHIGPTVPATSDVLDRLLSGTGEVLDVGCGRGDTLVRNASRIRCGVGIDQDPLHVSLAHANFSRCSARNLRAVRCHARDLCFRDASFDIVFSERGPLGHNDHNLSEAVRVLRAGGHIFIETLGEWNLREMKKHYEPGYIMPPSSLGCLQAEEERFARQGLKVETLASRLQTLRFANFYEWLRYQCTVWCYLGEPLPPPDDPGPFEKFAAETTDRRGRVHLTYHTIWIGGVKPASMDRV